MKNNFVRPQDTPKCCGDLDLLYPISSSPFQLEILCGRYASRLCVALPWHWSAIIRSLLRMTQRQCNYSRSKGYYWSIFSILMRTCVLLQASDQAKQSLHRHQDTIDVSPACESNAFYSGRQPTGRLWTQSYRSLGLGSVQVKQMHATSRSLLARYTRCTPLESTRQCGRQNSLVWMSPLP